MSPALDLPLPPGTRIHQVMFGGLGGHSSVGLSLVSALPHLRHSVTFFGTEPPSAALVAQLDALGVRWSSVSKRVGLDVRSLAAVAQDVASRGPDAVLMHSASTGPTVLPLCRARRIPVLSVDHTPADAKERREWLALGLGLVGAHATVFLTPQAEADARVRFSRLVRRARTRVIPNGIDVARFAPKLSSSPRKITVSMLSRFAPLRDHVSLVSAVARVLERRPELRQLLRVVLAGHGPTHAQVAEHALRLGVADVVELPGVLDEPAVVRLLQDSDLYVHSSLAETMSTAVMQAMSTGLPTIATRIPGMDFLIDHEVDGVLVAPRDVEALATAMLRLLSEEKLAKALGAAAREVAVRRFSSQTMAAGYAALIAEISGGGT